MTYCCRMFSKPAAAPASERSYKQTPPVRLGVHSTAQPQNIGQSVKQLYFLFYCQHIRFTRKNQYLFVLRTVIRTYLQQVALVFGGRAGAPRCRPPPGIAPALSHYAPHNTTGLHNCFQRGASRTFQTVEGWVAGVGWLRACG